MENLLEAWQEFVRGKRHRRDVQEFERDLMTNILALHRDLTAKTYTHSPHQAFNISDPKPRNIHKASVRDRLLHHALYRVLYPFFDRTFIADSFSCRKDRGMHKAINRFREFGYIVSKNNTRTCWVLKCDIRKFFASIDHNILLCILWQYIPDKDILWLLECVIGSFASTAPGKGLPLGNLTSQLFANVYLNEFDQFVRHKIHFKHYVRYADDFIFLSEDRMALQNALPLIDGFLRGKLKLVLHPQKVFIKTLASGVDFLGWVHFPFHRVLRISTKRRMMKRLEETPSSEIRESYLGLLRHGNAHKLTTKITGTDTKYAAFPL